MASSYLKVIWSDDFGMHVLYVTPATRSLGFSVVNGEFETRLVLGLGRGDSLLAVGSREEVLARAEQLRLGYERMMESGTFEVVDLTASCPGKTALGVKAEEDPSR